MENRFRKDFPKLNDPGYVYLDSAATSLKPQVVIDAVDRYLSQLSANIHRGVYFESYESTRLYEETREIIADFINADVSEIVYTRGATSALNFVATAYGSTHLNEGDEIVVSELEHHSMLLPWQAVAAKTKAKLIYVPLDTEGRITAAAVQSVLSKRTKIVALTAMSNVFGYQTPIEAIVPIVHAAGAIIVVDAAQAIQHINVDVRQWDVDFLGFSGHKMLGPTGIGVLYGKKALLQNLEPIEYGGDMNDQVGKFVSEWKDIPHRFEAGTMPIAEVIGLGEAIKYLKQVTIETIEHDTTRLYRYTVQQLKKIPGITIYNANSEAGIIAFNIDNVHPHDAASFYAEQRVCLRAGHHCAQLVMQWLGIEASLRASLFFYNTYADADKFLQTTKAAVAFFQRVGF
ncbi:MAG: SufS family cysteine desulfurase [Bacillus subtilis]|nr:SufS family cysteine desulfurase [Bacillus subtilis]